MLIDKTKVNLLEKDIEECLWNNPSDVHCEHFRVTRWLKRQYQVHSGILDLLGVTENHHLVVVEVKNVPIDASALTQVSRYAFDIANAAGKVSDIYMGHDPGGLHVYKMVIGRSINNKTMLEAEALNVQFMVFNVNMTLNLTSYSWTESYEAERLDTYNKMQDDDDLLTVIQERIVYQDRLKRRIEKWMVDGYCESNLSADTGEMIDAIEQELSEAN